MDLLYKIIKTDSAASWGGGVVNVNTSAEGAQTWSITWVCMGQRVKYQCSVCGNNATSVKENSMNPKSVILSRSHTLSETCSCDQCGIKSQTTDWFKIHEERKHTYNVNDCEKCSSRLRRYRHLKIHVECIHTIQLITVKTWRLGKVKEQSSAWGSLWTDPSH